MKRKTTCFAFLLLAMLAMITPGFSQSYITRHYTTLSGLPTSSIYCIAQDSEGCIWMATENGVSRYDGIYWNNYSEETGLPDVSFLRLAVDSRDRVWALSAPHSEGLSLVYFDGKQWEAVNPLRRNDYTRDDITAFQLQEKPDKSIAILVGTRNEGVFRWESGSWKQFTVAEGLPGNSVRGIVLSEDDCFIATNVGLVIINSSGILDSLPLHDSPLPSNTLTGVGVQYKNKFPDYPSSHDRIWITGPSWLGFLENRRFHKVIDFDKTVFLGNKSHVSIQPDYRRGIFLADNVSNYYFDLKNKQLDKVEKKNGLVETGADTQFIDFEKNIWIPCNRGVTKISVRHFLSFYAIHGLLEDEVSAILEFQPGQFIFGHNNGFTLLRNGAFTPVPFEFPSLPNNLLKRVMDIKIDKRENIWMAVSNSGVLKRTPAGKLIRYSGPQGLPGYISTLYTDASDNLWAGGNEGIFLLRGDQFDAVSLGEFSVGAVHRIIGDASGLRAIVTAGKGFFLRRPAGWKNYQLQGRNKVNYLYSALELPNDSWLLGTLGGLYILRDEKISFFREKNFQLNRPVYFILKTSDQVIWFGTDDGVMRWDGKSGIRYSVLEGLRGIETNRAAAIEDSGGRLWFGVNNGVSVYFKEMDSHFSWNPPPRVRLLSIQAGDKFFPPNAPLELDFNRRNLVFLFRAISFSDEDQIRLRSQLEGFDDSWTEEAVSNKNFIRYPNAPPGKFRFRLAARNFGGAWSQDVISPEIIIRKPFYFQFWFYGLMAFLLILLAYIIARYFTHRRNASLLEKMVDERSQQFQASEKRYRELFEESHDLIFVLTRQGEFLEINPAALSLIGFSSREELAESRIRDIFAFAAKEKETFWNDMQVNGFVKDFELQLRKPSGEVFILMLTATALRDELGKVFAIRGIARDISITRKLQQQLIQAQKMEAIGTLAGGIAHDFNNILGVITGYIDLSIDELPEGTRLRNNVDQVKVAALRGKEMVNQILIFSRENSLERSPLKIAPILNETLKFLRASLPMTIELRHSIQAESVFINSNPTNIHQVLMNLCTNSVHAMRDRNGILEISLRETELDEDSVLAYQHLVPGRYVRLSVSDTGHGIDPTVLPRIFEPYFTTKKQGEGTGMGLSVIHGIVKNSGGDIKVYSEPGKGATFHILFPIVSSADETPHPHLPTISLSSGGSEHILLVDDEELLVEVGRQMLEKLGYRVTVFSRSMEALARFQHGPDDFDLVISDLIMPEVTGVQLIQKIKNLRPSIPIILCTGFSETITSMQVRELGVDALLLKPVDKNSIASAVRNALVARLG